MRKACPVVVRKTAGRLEVLVFRHPLAGKQLVKGSIEFAETVERAALRELYEEGDIGSTAIAYLGSHQMADPAREWHFVVCGNDILPDAWTHRTSDGGGLDFAFFWRPLDEMPNDEWHPIFRDALDFIRRRIDR